MKNGDTEGAPRKRDEDGNTLDLSESGGRPRVQAGRDDPWRSVVGFRGLVWGVSTVLLVAWCVVALGIGVNYAHTFWEWLPIMMFGLGVPAGILWQANKVLAPGHDAPLEPSAKDKEKELLALFSERKELTAVTAAMRTSLTADEASRVLEGLVKGGHLHLRIDDGVQAYALPGSGMREALTDTTPDTAETLAVPPFGAGGSDRPPGEDLSERELEVLTLLASGRTNSEVAGDLFVAQGTVKAHVANIYRKLGANNRAEALARARELKLLP
jgi:DNA-binding CsgD family transcriptional regulator